MDQQARKAKRQFEQWRPAHGGRGRIPEWLWAEAVELASARGVEETARALKVNASALERRVRRTGDEGDASDGSFPGFVEVPVPPVTDPSECTVEAEDPGGKRLKVHLRGEATSQAASVARALWEGQE